MATYKINKYLIFILFIILAALTSAFIIEYILLHTPCNLCLYERVPYIISIFLILEILFIKKHVKTSLLLLSLIFILSAGLAFYHFGIEQGFFNESFACKSKDISEITTKDELLEQLKRNTISCKEVTFKVIGLSLASINTIFSIFLSVIFLKLYSNYEKD
jgi:disulfide bond formation protein DsbB